MRFHDPDEPVYVISVASRLLGVSAHMLRMLEREGLLEPARTEKNIRLYSENDLLRLRRICHLMRQEGVNIAGVRAILRIETRRESAVTSGEERRAGYQSQETNKYQEAENRTPDRNHDPGFQRRR